MTAAKTQAALVWACAWCGTRPDQTAIVEDSGRLPEAGDWSVCRSCGGFNRFQANLTLRGASALEVVQMPATLRKRFLRLRQRIREPG
jgi:hypothetical protein